MVVRHVALRISIIWLFCFNYWDILPDDGNHNEEVADSPDEGDDAVEDEEYDLNLGDEDELLLGVAVVEGAALWGQARIVHSADYLYLSGKERVLIKVEIMELLTISDFYIFLFLISCSTDRKTNKQFKVEDVLQKNVVYTKLNYN